jgi:transketolase
LRNAFVAALTEMASDDERIFLITADLGWSVLEKFAQRFPDRFLNVGVAEANMAGIATGLAQVGFVPFIYSIATFASMRCYEQVRDGALLHHLPVRIIGVGGGYAYGHAGPTHYALEDLAIARTQPGMTVLAPADPAQTRTALRATVDIPGAVYMRVGKGGNPEVPGLNGRFTLNQPELIHPGSDVLLLTCGAITHEALRSAAKLREMGISSAVSVLAHIHFSPSPSLIELLSQFRAVIVLEEGYAAGGLGSLVAEAIATNQLPCRLEILGVTEPFSGISGSEKYMRAQSGIDAQSCTAAAQRLLAFSV